MLLPSVLTLWLLVQAYRFVDSSIATPINEGIRLAVIQIDRRTGFLPPQFEPSEREIFTELAETATDREPLDADAARQLLRERAFVEWWNQRWYLNLLGLLVAVVAVYLAGRLVGGLIGRSIYRRVERVLTSVPIVKHIYPHVKQVVDFLLSDDRPMKFNRVVAIEYPRKGIWSIGLVTGEGMRPVQASAGDSMTIFIPSSPTPFTGYTITVPRGDTVDLDLTIDEALRFVVTAGVLVPPRHAVAASLDGPAPDADPKPPTD